MVIIYSLIIYLGNRPYRYSGPLDYSFIANQNRRLGPLRGIQLFSSFFFARQLISSKFALVSFMTVEIVSELRCVRLTSWLY